MFIGNRQEEAIYILSSPVYIAVMLMKERKLTANTLMTSAGDFFTKVIIMVFKLKSILYPPDVTVINRRR